MTDSGVGVLLFCEKTMEVEIDRFLGENFLCQRGTQKMERISAPGMHKEFCIILLKDRPCK